MIIAVVLQLESIDYADLSQGIGRQAQVWFLDEIARYNHPLAEKLHSGSTTRPYTISALLGTPTGKLAPGQLCSLRITSFLPELSELIQ
jgi:hypothetical protein